MRKFPKGFLVMEPPQQVFPWGVRKIINFRGGSTKNNNFPRVYIKKLFPMGSKIRNLLNRGV